MLSDKAFDLIFMNAKSDIGRKIRKMFYYIKTLREEMEKCEEKDKLIENLKTSEESYKVKYLKQKKM